MTPSSTYRLQLHPGFGFADVAAIADYLAALGVTHLYASPYLQAAPGSSHGYDVVDHRHVNEELGGATAHLEMCHRLGEAGLGQVLDIVPNHMAIGPSNAWWWDVLENGPASHYASYFDVDWDPPEAHLRNLVLVPVLGDHYGRVLESGELVLTRDGARFEVCYHEHRYPIAPRSLDAILAPAAERTQDDDLAFLSDAFRSLPLAASGDPADARRRHRDKEVLKRLLAHHLDDDRIAGAVDEVIAELNRDPDRLDALLERQNYRLARWQLGTHQLDYRRFFDVTGLIGLRTEDERVFRDTHDLIIGWLRTGLIDGARIDHIDGLRDPTGYLDRLVAVANDGWIVVEKILEGTEQLPDWPIAGTTGYEIANRVTGVLVDPDGEGPLTELYRELTGAEVDWSVVRRGAKRDVLDRVLAADVARVANLFLAVCEHHRRHRDYSRQELAAVLTEVLVALPVYRTYVRRRPDGSPQLSIADRTVIDETIATVAADTPDIDHELLELLGQILRLEIDGDEVTDLCVAFQQLSGPTMAKGVEDTAFYRYHRFVALNEVGGDPGQFGTSLAELHHANELHAKRWPTTMLSTSTHDTKRSEDVRARLAVLSEMPEAWAATVRRWMAHNEAHRTDGLPDRAAEYLLYQTLVGAHPLTVDRASAYMLKAVREAKTHTSWLTPDAAYEAALQSFVERLFADDRFQSDLAAFVDTVREPGRINSLSQSLVKMTSPGVPDIYQGNELWDLSLVDPDNRRPVAFDVRRALLEEIRSMKVDDAFDPGVILGRADEGLPKLWVLLRTLAVRRAHPEAFGAAGGYQAVHADGRFARHVVAFLRGAEVLPIAQRWSVRRGADWADTTIDLPDGAWADALTGGRHTGPGVRVADVLAGFPVALLVRQRDGRRGETP